MRLIDADDLEKVINEIFDTVEVVTFDDIIATIDNAPTITPKEFEPLVEAIMDALPVIVEKTVPAIVEKIERVLETIQTVIDDTNGKKDNVSKAMRNTAKFIRNAIDGEMPDYENIEGEDCGERPTGKWDVDIIGHKGDKTTIMRFKCSNCGTVISWIPGEKYPTKETFLNAHPGCFCGARMEVPADEQKTGN